MPKTSHVVLSESTPLRASHVLHAMSLQSSSLLTRSCAAVAVVVGVAVSWACATQFSKSALNLDPDRFYAPYSLVWFSTIFMVVCYPVYLVYAAGIRREPLREVHCEAMDVFGYYGFSLSSFLLRVTPFLVLWVAANYSYSQSLGHISASAASAIMSSNIAMVCVLSWVVLREPFDVFKVLAVLCAIGGVIIISLDNEFAGSLLGVGLVVASAFFAAVYKVLFKRLIGDASLGQVSAFMSALGVLNTFVNFVPTLALVLTGLDKVDFSYVPWGALIGSAVLSLLFNFLVNFGIALLNPLVISVGMLCGIPVSILIDILFRDLDATAKFIGGASLILVSFVLCAFPLRELCRRAKCSSKTSYDVTVVT